MKRKGCAGVAALLGLIVVVALGFGWVRNVVRFCNCDFEAPYKAEVIRGVGIFVVPVGIVAGDVTIEDGPVAK
jgi:hypothetical protein